MSRNETFKDRLRLALKESRFTSQKALADHLGIREGTVSGWLTGSWPNEESLRALVEALDVSAHWLLTNEGDMRPTPPDESAVKVKVIGRIIGDEIDAATLQRLSEGPAAWIAQTIGERANGSSQEEE